MTVQTGQYRRLVRRVRKLAAEVVELVERNKRHPEEVAEILQEIIDDPSRNPVPGPLSRKDYKRLVRSWDVHFPGMGRRIVDLLAPLYSPELSLKLRPAMAGLEEQVKKAIFWIEVPRIEVVHPDSSEITGERINPEDLERSLEHFFKDSEPLDRDRMMSVQDVCYEALWSRVYRRLERDYMVDDGLHCNIHNVAEYAAACLIAGDTSKDFRPLIELFTTGNLPYEFENDGTLYVLCAKEEPSV